ncbi:hypothetical protein N0N85_004452 [Escherichia coli]|nr:hypothetical protein [Escherichia coli]
MNKVTLGEVIRNMVSKAMESSDGEFKVPVREIFKVLRGRDYPELKYDVETDEIINLKERSIPELKNSYIYNTVSRMPQLRVAGKHAKHKIIWIDDDGEQTSAKQFDGDGADKYLVIQICDGEHKKSESARRKIDSDAAVIESFKSRLMKVVPSVMDLDGERKVGAEIAIGRFYDLIKDAK